MGSLETRSARLSPPLQGETAGVAPVGKCADCGETLVEDQFTSDDQGRLICDNCRDVAEVSLPKCPFCGATPHRGPAKLTIGQDGESFQRYRVWCPKGHASVDGMNEAQAVAEWSLRTPAVSVPDGAEGVLEPCPFCGSGDIEADGWLTSGGVSGPACSNCGASAGRVNARSEDNIAAWNRRASPPPPALGEGSEEPDGFLSEDFASALSPLLSGHEPIVQAGLSNNLNVIIAALRRCSAPHPEGQQNG